MDIPEQTRERIARILDELGPGMTLVVDRTILRAAFDDELAPARFAKDRDCGFRHGEGEVGAGTFFRAYIKRN